MEKGIPSFQPASNPFWLEIIAGPPFQYAKVLKRWRWFPVLLLSFTLVFGEDDVEITAMPLKPEYATSDTVIIVVKVLLPSEHVLYGNPKGPGAGRPLALSITCDNPGVRWLTVKKLKAEKYGPAFGEWVWVYRNETLFFCTGVITAEYDVRYKTCEGTINFEGLLCRDACRMMEKSAPFVFTIKEQNQTAEQPGPGSDMQRKYKSAVWMMDLRHSVEECGSAGEPLQDARLRWKKVLE